MQIARSYDAWPVAARGSVMALGNFDGVHQGHRAVIETARTIAKSHRAPLSVMTFEPHPRRFFRPDLPILRIVPFSEKARLLGRLEVDYLFAARFNHAFSTISAEDFLQDILVRKLGVKHIVTGYDFAFGHARSGDADFLARHAPGAGATFTQVDQVVHAGERPFSSTAIRAALKEGDMAQAAAMLGRHYQMQGLVIHGDKRGASIGFPTANIRPAPLFLPKRGVYAVRLHLPDGRVFDAVANLGVRPTVDGSHCLLEVHAFAMDEKIYGQKVRVQFYHFLRSEQKFNGVDDLKAQIGKDKQEAEQFFARLKQGEAQ